MILYITDVAYSYTRITSEKKVNQLSSCLESFETPFHNLDSKGTLLSQDVFPVQSPCHHLVHKELFSRQPFK